MTHRQLSLPEIGRNGSLTLNQSGEYPVLDCQSCGEPLRLRQIRGQNDSHSYLECGCGTIGRDRPPYLDLFCGVGGVGRSLQMYGHRSGCDLLGVDNDASKAASYPGPFIEWDLTEGLPRQLQEMQWEMAWASPPCQFATSIQYARSGTNLIPDARRRLREVNATVMIIENVPGAAHHLIDPVMFCGSAFDLGVRKHRVFETSFPSYPVGCNHPDRFRFCIGDREAPVTEYRAAHGFDQDVRLGAKQLRECIPAAYVHELLDQYLRWRGDEMSDRYRGGSLSRVFKQTGGVSKDNCVPGLGECHG